jgi:serine/threonine-protein kinase
VYVDGDSAGTTPLREPLTLAPGAHEVAFRNPRFPASLSYTRTVEVLPGEAADLTFSFWDHIGQITLQVNPWAHVYVDDVYRDATPLDQPLILAPGPHVLRLEHPQLGVLQDTVRVTAGTSETLRYDMREAHFP